MPGRKLSFHLLIILAATAGLALAGVAGFRFLDRAFPPDLSQLAELSHQVVDREARPLRTYLTRSGLHRLPATVGDVDPRYLAMLVAYEDKRFWQHAGVDPLAVLRAAGQALVNGRVVSGASTLTMQTARLLEPRPRTLFSKFIEMLRALQLERHFSKSEILGMYLTLAPFGGNIEGVPAAAQAYFQRPAKNLTLAEAALLVALPRSPSRFRPDRHPDRAYRARNVVLARVKRRLGLDNSEVKLATAEPVPERLYASVFLAPHLADRLSAERPLLQATQAAIDASLQRQLEAMALGHARNIGPRVSVAILVAKTATREVLAYVGSADFRATMREGQVDIVRAIRSPGSALKPIIYGLAFDRGLAHPATLVNDVPTQFGDYAPANFMQQHMGEVSLTEALQQSLNVPAVAVLERLGPVAMVERLRRAGMTLAMASPDATPGLAVALGGIGTTLEDLVRLYAALGGDGRFRPLRYLVETSVDPVNDPPAVLLRAPARWYIGEILRRMPPPGSQVADGRRRNARRVAFKTGTSFGFRDAWAIGYNAAHTVGVWVGRPDGAPNPGHFGASTAAPLLFRVFEQLPNAIAEPQVRPRGALPMDTVNLPPGQKVLSSRTVLLDDRSGPPPRIVYPMDRTVINLPAGDRPLGLQAEGGRRPLTWLIDGVPLATRRWQRGAEWRPLGPGFSEIVLLDALGRQAKARVRLVTMN